MLNHYLDISARNEGERLVSVKLASWLKNLPNETLERMAAGQVKVADAIPKEGMGGDEWVDKFKGTPLFEQAVALEKAQLQNDIARQQMEASRPRLEMDQFWQTDDQIRLQKKLLDLELLDSAGGAPMQAGGQLPEQVPAAQGAGALGDAATATEQPGAATGDKVVTASAFHLPGATKVSHPILLNWADAMGRSMARGEQEKLAALESERAFMETAGKALTKIALDPKMLGSIVNFAKKNPSLVGAGVGAVGGAVAGGPDHRLSGALGGAALGHAAGGIGSRMAGGGSLGEAAKAYGGQVKGQAEGLLAKAKGKLQGPAGAPAAGLKAGPGHVQQMPAVTELPSSALQEVAPSKPPPLPARARIQGPRTQAQLGPSSVPGHSAGTASGPGVVDRADMNAILASPAHLPSDPRRVAMRKAAQQLGLYA